MRQTPFGLTAGAEMIMTFFWRDDTHIALCETAETGVTISLTKAFISLSATVNAFNILQKLKSKIFSNEFVKPDRLSRKR